MIKDVCWDILENIYFPPFTNSSRYKLMSCPRLKKPCVLKLFILMLIEASLSLLYAVIDKSNLSSTSWRGISCSQRYLSTNKQQIVQQNPSQASRSWTKTRSVGNVSKILLICCKTFIAFNWINFGRQSALRAQFIRQRWSRIKGSAF